jgi:hypothetical protein
MTVGDTEFALRELQEKARLLVAEKISDGIKELIFVNLIDQAYYTGQHEAAQAALRNLLEKS